MLYDDIVEDGQFGPGTLSVLKKYMKTDQASYIIKIANLLQGGHYLEYMKKSPGQEKYARGWLNRVSL
jgi:lysozyme family protein